MTQKNQPKQKLENIPIQKIDPSPFQKRKYFDELKLKDLAISIQTDGLIEPIIARQKGNRYELIAGDRRLRAIKTFTPKKTIQAKIIQVDDLQARRISAAENLQRQDFSAVETIEAIVEIVDAHLIENQEYVAMGDRPETRVYYLLGKLHSIHISKNRQSTISENGMLLFSKFTKQVESIFQLLPKRLEWISFYTNDLPLIMEICEDVRQISLENQLNKSQFKAISEVKKNHRMHFNILLILHNKILIPKMALIQKSKIRQALSL